MTLTAISLKGRDRAELSFSDGSQWKTSARVVGDLGLYQGMELSEEQYELLMHAAGADSARQRAARIVAAHGISERDLTRRLTDRGESPEDAAAAVDWLRELGALDDRALAEQTARSYVQRGYGPGRVRQELIRRGIPREHLEEVLAGLPDTTEAIDRFLEKKLRGRIPDRREKGRLIAALQRRGHSWEDIQSSLRRYLESYDF